MMACIPAEFRLTAFGCHILPTGLRVCTLAPAISVCHTDAYVTFLLSLCGSLECTGDLRESSRIKLSYK